MGCPDRRHPQIDRRLRHYQSDPARITAEVAECWDLLRESWARHNAQAADDATD
jgi:hypothetical protein